jgi:PAS domain S-box-containing protein
MPISDPKPSANGPPRPEVATPEQNRQLEHLSQLFATLNEIGRAIARATDQQQVFDVVCRLLVANGGYRMAWIGWLDAATREVRPVASAGDEHGYLRSVRVTADAGPEGAGPTGAAIRTGRTEICEDFASDPRTAPWHAEGARSGWRASVAVPIAVGGDVTGALSVYAGMPDWFGPHEVALLESAAGEIAFALDSLATRARQQRAEAERADLLARQTEVAATAERARDLMRSLLDRVSDGFVALDLKWHYTYVNPRAARLLQRQRPEDLIGRHIWTEYPEGVGQPFHLAYERAMQTQQPLLIEDYYAPWDRWFENRIYPSPDGLSIYFSDISERKRTELALAASERSFRHFFDAGLVGMAITVPDKGWGRFNRRLCEMLGYDEQQMTGLTWAEVTHPDDLAADVAQFERVMRGDTDGYTMDKRFIRRDGSVLHAAIAVRCARDDAGRIERFFAIVEDISERKRVEQALARHGAELEHQVQQRTAELLAARDAAEQASRAKTEFLSRMSHELRTPMNAILGFAQLMELERSAPPQVRAYGQEILRAGRHLLQLINEVLDLSAVESGRLPLAIETLRLIDVVAEVDTLVAPLAQQRGIALGVTVDAELGVRADRLRLKQVLLNLLSNAIKYNRPQGRVTLHAAREGAQVRIAVADTGPGIAEADLPRLFQPFSRLAAGERTEGSGIGLSLSQRLAQLMGGAIGVRSTPGEGSEFWITLPAAGVDEASPETARTGAGRRKLLYVEDNPVNVALVEQILARSARWELLVAPTADIGLDLARAHQPALVVIDLNLPDMNGYQLLAQLRADPHTCTLPVAALTAHATDHDAQRVRAAGFDAYLAKPLNLREFDAMIARLADR